jgi:hypothetical protein
LQARTSPNRSNINLPVSIAELRDIPRMIYLSGKGVARKVASGNLSYQFGWKPVLSDLKKALHFQSGVAKRLSELDRLASGGLRRKRNLINPETNRKVTDHGVFNRSPIGAHIYVRERTVETVERWGTIRYRPGSLIKDPRTDRDRLARKLFLGLNTTQIVDNIWEGLPWSWMIDWFSNAGDLLSSLDHQVATTSSTSIMTHYK